VTTVDRSRLPDVGSDPAFAFPQMRRHRLSAGLDLRTIEHRSLPVLALALQVADGSGSDPAGREGLAALTADMLDEGVGDLSALDVAEALERIGAEYHVDVDADATTIAMVTLTRHASRGAELLAGSVLRPSLREEDFSRVRQLRLDRLRQVRDQPAAMAERGLLHLLYGTHPYGHLPIGATGSLRALTSADVAAFHAAAYRPDRATLVMVGDLEHDAMRDIAEAAFGGWTPGRGREAARSPVETVTAAPGPSLAIVPREGAAQSFLRIGQLGPPRRTPDYEALLMMNAVLGGQFVSRMNLKLREEKGYTYGARTGFDWHRQASTFSVETHVDTAATVDAVLDALAELTDIRGARPVTEDELAVAKASLTRGLPRSFETAPQVARIASHLVLYDLPDTHFEDLSARVRGMRAEEVSQVAAAHLHPDRFSTLIVGDPAVGARLAQTLGLGEPVVLSPEV